MSTDSNAHQHAHNNRWGVCHNRHYMGGADSLSYYPIQPLPTVHEVSVQGTVHYGDDLHDFLTMYRSCQPP